MKKPLTIEDIKNPQRKSGFDHVHFHSGPKPWQASGGGRKLINGTRFPSAAFHGPRRAAPDEAAQDYCDHVNGNSLVAPVKLRPLGATPGPRPKKESSDPRVVKGQKLIAKGRKLVSEGYRDDPSGWVYLMFEVGDATYCKIGKSGDDPVYRLPEMQTGNPRELYMAAQIWSEDRHKLEAEAHAKFIDDNHGNEWFLRKAEILEYFGVESRKKVAA